MTILLASVGGFVVTSVAVHYGFAGTLLGCPTWAWALVVGFGLGLGALPSSMVTHWRQWKGV